MKKKTSFPIITVALPMYRAKMIGWLAIEGLTHQKNAPPWELSIAEEIFDSSQPMGLENVKHYEDGLYRAGCVSITYIPIEKWMPLSQKWKLLANHSIGEIMLLQAADCYPHPYRLKNSYMLMNASQADWYQAPFGYFYSISRNRIYYFDRRKHPHPCGLNMAVKMEWMRQLPDETIQKYVDSWLYKSIQHKKLEKTGTSLSVIWDESDDWKHGLDTNGFNTISLDREHAFDNLPCFSYRADLTLTQIVPKNVADKLYDLHNQMNEAHHENSIASMHLQ
ncbi:MAG: hypothetical protein ONB13_05465 [candidate division KSB1 bacterium]|nr:hypothetical protein [candidate division KSB1 bacterium]